MRFQVVFTFDDGHGGYVADVPELPGCISQGKPIEEATANVREAIQGYLNVMAERGEPYIPDSKFVIVGEVAVERCLRFPYCLEMELGGFLKF